MIAFLLVSGCSRPDSNGDSGDTVSTSDDTGLPCIDDPPTWVNECSEGATPPLDSTVDGCVKYSPDENWPPACTMTESLANKCESVVGREACNCLSGFVRARLDRGLAGLAYQCVASDGTLLDVYGWSEQIPGSNCEGFPMSYGFTARFRVTDGELVEIQEEIVSSSVGSCGGAWCCGEDGVVASYLSWGKYHRLESCDYPMDLVALLAEDTGCP